MGQILRVSDMSEYSHYCATVVKMKKSSLRRRMTKTGDGRLVPVQTVMMMRGMGSGQKRASMALCDWSWLSLPHVCLCPGTTVHCPGVPGVVGGQLSADTSAVAAPYSGSQPDAVIFYMNTDILCQLDGSLLTDVERIPVQRLAWRPCVGGESVCVVH